MELKIKASPKKVNPDGLLFDVSFQQMTRGKIVTLLNALRSHQTTLGQELFEELQKQLSEVQ